MRIRCVCLGIVLAACSIQSAGADSKAEESGLKAMPTAQTDEQAKYLREMYAVFRIVDPKFAHKTLEKAPDYRNFCERIDEWAKADTVRWSDLMNRLDYCNQLQQNSYLGTPIDAAEPDVRWEIFLRNGPPSNEVVLPGSCVETADTCLIWTFTWLPDAEYRQGRELSCHSRRGEKYPTKIIFGTDLDFPVAARIFPIVNCSIFPAPDGTSDIWFSVWVPGDQFTRATLAGGQLTMEFQLFDSTESTLLKTATIVSKLQVIKGILEATQFKDRHLIRAMGYSCFSFLTAGSYRAKILVDGAKHNSGECSIDINVSAQSDISSLLVLTKSATTGENFFEGIHREGRSGLYDNPEAWFAPGEKLNLYAEAFLPEAKGSRPEVTVSLLPLPRLSSRRKGTVQIGTAVVMSDSLDQPIIGGGWRSPEDLDILESLVGAADETKSITLLKKRFDANSEHLILELSPRLKDKLKSGRYLLTLKISDPDHKKYYLTTRRVIRVGSIK